MAMIQKSIRIAFGFLILCAFPLGNIAAQEFSKIGYLEKRAEIIRRIGDNRSDTRVMKMKTQFREKDLLAVGNERNYHLIHLIPFENVDSLTYSLVTFKYLPLAILKKTPLAEYTVIDYGPPPPKWLTMALGKVAGNIFDGVDSETGSSFGRMAKDIAEGHPNSIYTNAKIGNWLEIAYTRKGQNRQPIFQVDADEEERFLTSLQETTNKPIRKFINGTEIFSQDLPFPNSWYEITKDLRILILIVFTESELSIIGNDPRWYNEKRIAYKDIRDFKIGQSMQFGITGFRSLATKVGRLKISYVEKDSSKSVNLLIGDAKAAYNILSEKIDN
jgi:hypothetical protein